MITTKEELAAEVKRLGFLPFFANEIPGFSVEEKIDRRLWFSEEPGPWDWKGPLIVENRFAYGKFFDKKAGFITREWFRDFANFRGDGYDFDSRFEDGLATYNQQFLYEIITSHHSILSKTAKAVGGYVKPKTKSQDRWEPRKGFDTLITKLQMQCYVLTSDFEYETDRNGNYYGWGIARYSTPEEFFGKYFTGHVYDRSPEESRERVIRHLQKVLPETERNVIEHFLR